MRASSRAGGPESRVCARPPRKDNEAPTGTVAVGQMSETLMK